MPTAGFDWIKTWQPIVVGEWTPSGRPRNRRFSTVMTWQIKSFAEIGGNKDQQFLRFIVLPDLVGDRFELAVNGPHDLLRAHGWDTVDAMVVSRTTDRLPRLHPRVLRRVRRRQAHVRVDAAPGGSAIGRSAISPPGGRLLVQDTGWSSHLPAGEGLLAFRTPGRGRRGHREHRRGLRASRAAAPGRSRATTSTRPSSCRASSSRPSHDPPLRIAHVGPVAMQIPPQGSGSVELMTSLLTEGLVAARPRRDAVRDGATRTTSARLHATFDEGYVENPDMWPWELYEMLNLSAAVERAEQFDVIHYEAAYYPMSLAFARLSPTPIVQTLHHSPSPGEVALWSRYPEVPFVAISQRAVAAAPRRDASRHRAARDRHRLVRLPSRSGRLPVVPRPVHGRQGCASGDRDRQEGRQRASCSRLPRTTTTASTSARSSTARDVVYVGEVGHDEKVRLAGGARALLYPVQSGEPFGLVLAEAMACGTPVAAIDRGAVTEVVDDGVTGLRLPGRRSVGRGLLERVRARSGRRSPARRRTLRHRSHGRRVHRGLRARRPSWSP